MDNKIKGRFGFGCMRLPLLENGEVDLEQFTKMVDRHLEAGFNYFDTAHVYHHGNSEKALKQALTSRYSHDDYVLADKLTKTMFNSHEDILPAFEEQLEI